ncbi:MAG: AraC family transcriptional regulator [Pseudomonadota bacterium]
MTQNGTLFFSTEQFPEAGRVDGWRELFGRSVCELDINPRQGSGFRASAILRVLPGLGIASGTSSGARYWRPRELIRSDDVVVVINHDGTDLAEMFGRQQIVAAGEAVMFSAEHVGGMTNSGASRYTTLRMPKAALAPALPDFGAAILSPVGTDSAALRLLKNYLGVLEDDGALTESGVQELIAANIHDLVAIAFGAKGDAAEIARRRGVFAARLRAIKSDIQLNAGDLDFGISVIARRHGITPRYIQKLFDSTGTTFTDYVMRCRLANAYRMLRDEKRKGDRIGDIALDAGFASLSYFNRAFRKQFSATPIDVRGSKRDECRAP